jgi:hypothetical protein
VEGTEGWEKRGHQVGEERVGRGGGGRGDERGLQREEGGLERAPPRVERPDRRRGQQNRRQEVLQDLRKRVRGGCRCRRRHGRWRREAGADEWGKQREKTLHITWSAGWVCSNGQTRFASAGRKAVKRGESWHAGRWLCATARTCPRPVQHRRAPSRPRRSTHRDARVRAGALLSASERGPMPSPTLLDYQGY